MIKHLKLLKTSLLIDLIKSSYNRISTIIKDIEMNIKINGEIKNTDKNTLWIYC